MRRLAGTTTGLRSRDIAEHWRTPLSWCIEPTFGRITRRSWGSADPQLRRLAREQLGRWQLRSKCAMLTLVDEFGMASDEASSQTAFDAISGRLATLAASEDAHRLWAEVREEFEIGGPAGVKALIDSRVRALARTAQKDLKETRSVARTTVPERKKKPAKAKPRTRKT